MLESGRSEKGKKPTALCDKQRAWLVDAKVMVHNLATAGVETESASRRFRLWLLGDVLSLKAR